MNPNCHLTSLNGIEKLAGLKGLDASGNKLKNVNEVKRLTKLEDLDLSNNRLTSMKALKNLKNLKTLRVMIYSYVQKDWYPANDISFTVKNK